MTHRIAIVTPSLAPLGALAALEPLIESWDFSGFEFHIISRHGDYPSSPFFRHSAFQIHQLNIPLGQVIAGPRVIRKLHEITPDWVHLWGLNNRRRLPVVANASQALSVSSAHRAKSSSFSPSDLLGINNRVPGPDEPLEMPQLTLMKRPPGHKARSLSATFSLLVNATIPEVPWAIGSPFIDPQRMIAVLSPTVRKIWVDRDAARQAIFRHLSIPPDSRLIVTTAALEPRTHLKEVIWANDLLHCIRDDVHLIVVGEGRQETVLRSFAESMDSSSHTHFMPLVDKAEQLIVAADVYWHSHLTDRWPTAVALAMAHNVPVVSAYGPTTQPLVRHQQTAWGVELGSRDQFARWTKFVLEQPEATRQMVQQAKSWVDHVTNHQLAQRQLTAFYHRVVSGMDS